MKAAWWEGPWPPRKSSLRAARRGPSPPAKRSPKGPIPRRRPRKTKPATSAKHAVDVHGRHEARRSSRSTRSPPSRKTRSRRCPGMQEHCPAMTRRSRSRSTRGPPSGAPIAAIVVGRSKWLDVVLYCGQALAEGTYTAQATQEDEAGNLGKSTTVTFTVVTKAPAVTINSVAAFTKNTTPTLTGGAGVRAADDPSVDVTIYEGSVVGGSVAASEVVLGRAARRGPSPRAKRSPKGPIRRRRPRKTKRTTSARAPR